MNKQEEAKKAIDLWALVEFLTQEDFPKYEENSRKIKKYVRSRDIYTKWSERSLDGEPERAILEIARSKDLTTYIEQGPKEINHVPKSIQEFLSETSNNYVIAGKIQKNDIFQVLRKFTGFEDDVENLVGEVAFFSMRLDSDGRYEEKSLQISPLVLMIHFINANKNKEDIRNKIQKDNINRFVESIEKELIEKVIEDNKISYNTLLEIQNKLSELLLEKTSLEIKSEVILIYPRFINEAEREKEEENLKDYGSLSRSFYKEELDYIRSEVGAMKNQLLDYILAQHKEMDIKGLENNRIDVLNCRSFIRENSDISLESAGKWPSKHSPAFMQQMAIHKYRALCGETEDEDVILSINGPPGTGKTTMLKEIVVDNIVNRASILSAYDDSSNAFENAHFSDGDKENQGYIDKALVYFKFKSEELKKYSMLVVSSNNAAVENITKELPAKSNLLGEIKKLGDTEKLFDISKSSHGFTIEKIKDNQKKEFYVKDIYFSVFADQLKKKKKLTAKAIEDKAIVAGSIEEDYIEEWGLISAALGKKANISEFNKYALTSIISQISKEKVNNYNDCFQNAKREFINQAGKVKDIRDTLNENAELEEKSKESILKIKNEIKSLDAEIKNNKKTLSNLREEKQLREVDCQSLEKTINKKINAWSQMNKHCSLEIFNYEEFNSLFQQAKSENDLAEKKCSQMNKGFLGKLLKNKNYVEYKEGQEKLAEFENFRNIVLPEYTILDNRKKELERIKSEVSKKSNKIRALIKANDKKANEIQSIREKIKGTIESIKENKIEMLDEKFLESLKSHDDQSKLDVHTKNLWTSSEFDREREKLFRYALDVHKYFILSSPEVRSNLCNLKLFWGLEPEKVMSDKDKEASFIHLLNTLFLLVPVISTTFASVGNFLRYAKGQSSLGHLIIDEAGQANPQFAVGALWRAKNTIIVGDPKQIEPVVTSDVKLLLKMFAPDKLENYSLGNNSVQSFADQINPYGSKIDNTWVGFPLIVHRRCIDPMFKISNKISYDGTMLLAPGQANDEEKFAIENSGFFSQGGTSGGPKNHYVEKQAKVALKCIAKYIESNEKIPSIFVISPFKTVIFGFKELAKKSDILKKCLEEKSIDGKVDEWIEKSCGTVHTFQGREADEVIFLLGCDREHGSGAVKWVNSNIVNVAVTRAKKRLMVIGDKKLWSENSVVKSMIDSLDELYNDEDCKGSLAKDVTNCKDCSGFYILKNGNYGQFWGCSKFPECKSTQSFNKISAPK